MTALPLAAQPIVNQAGADLYVAQAEFVSELGMFDPGGTNDLDFRLGASPNWHAIPRAAFAVDQVRVHVDNRPVSGG